MIGRPMGPGEELVTSTASWDIEEERFARLLFNMLPQISPIRFQKILDRFGSAAAALEAPAEAWADVEGLAPVQAERLHRAARDARPRAQAELEVLRRLGGRALIPGDEEFPVALKAVSDAPLVLYVRGDYRPVDSLAVALVGTRQPTPYGRAAAERLASELCRAGVTVVSGLARGIDTVVHDAALRGRGRTIGVLGSGLNHLYPPENKGLMGRMAASGAVFTEFPLNTPPDRSHFPRRNRLISGLSLAVVVVEADEASGALITARLAGEQGRDVFAVPGSVFSKMSRGPHRLLKQGAKLVEGVEDILEEIEVFRSLTRAPRPRIAAPALGDAETRLWAHLTLDPISVDDLSGRTGLPASAVSSALLGLELKGLVKNLPGGNFVRSRQAAEQEVKAP